MGSMSFFRSQNLLNHFLSFIHLAVLISLCSFAHAYDCSNILPYKPGPITTGTVVQNNDQAYECLVGGWCQQGGPYEPGVGWAAFTAWNDLGDCDSAEPNTFTATIPASVKVGETVNMSFSARPFYSIQWGIGTVTINGEEIPFTENWGSSVPTTSWTYVGAWQWTATEVGIYAVEIRIDHPRFPNSLIKTITVTPSEFDPVLTINSPTSITLGETATAVVNGRGLPEIADIVLTFDGQILKPDSIATSGAPEPYVVSAVYHITPSYPGTYALGAVITFANGESIDDSAQLEVIATCIPNGLEAWDETAVYLAGAQVYYDSTIYEAQFFTSGDVPPENLWQWGPWKVMGNLSCD